MKGEWKNKQPVCCVLCSERWMVFYQMMRMSNACFGGNNTNNVCGGSNIVVWILFHFFIPLCWVAFGFRSMGFGYDYIYHMFCVCRCVFQFGFFLFSFRVEKDFLFACWLWMYFLVAFCHPFTLFLCLCGGYRHISIALHNNREFSISLMESVYTVHHTLYNVLIFSASLDGWFKNIFIFHFGGFSIFTIDAVKPFFFTIMIKLQFFISIFFVFVLIFGNRSIVFPLKLHKRQNE